MNELPVPDVRTGYEAEADLRLLASLRTRLDAINLQILEMLEARGELVREVMAIKRRLGRTAYDESREKAMMEALLHRAGDAYPRESLEKIFGAIFAASRVLDADIDR
jgi:3-deoxy-7-phosphoheptulonate synthase/chorismate mutase